ncbi:MAG: DUF1801 domain-containing protein [Rhodobacteraceae bacterium]|nr:DUF1801 domain-containing protein [Paracoccaceae bacterium]
MDPQLHPFQSPQVADAFAAFPKAERAGLLSLRQLILEEAAACPDVGEIEETLKWGQPSYLTVRPKSGTTIRLGLPKQGGFALYVHCQTTLIADFQALFPKDFTYEGNRAVHFRVGQALPKDRIGLLIRAALTYHRKKPALQR